MRKLERELKIKRNYISVQGGKKLSGTVRPDGAKNSALIQLATAALTHDAWITLENMPRISDVDDSLMMLEEAGFHTKLEGNKAVISGQAKHHEFSMTYAARIRSSLTFLGSILPRQGEILLPLPGGDKIGDRPIDIHIDVLNAFDIESVIEGGYIHAKAKSLPLKGTSIFLRFPSVLATVNAILLAVLAEGKTVIHNVAKEPEIVDCTNLLSKMGAKIIGVGTDKISIEGVKELHGASHDVMPDRLETAALMMSIAATGGHGTVEKIIPEHNEPLIEILKSMNVDVKVEGDKIHLNAENIRGGFRVETRPYPGLATDIQPMMAALALKGQETCVITDHIFKERFAHVGELRKFGADITKIDNTITVHPVTHLNSAHVIGNDIRAVVSLINASLIIDGDTKIEGVYHLDRGHANYIEKLQSLNAQVKYID